MQPRDDGNSGTTGDDDSSVIASEARQSLLITGDSNDAVTLSQLFADGHTEGQWSANGQVTQNGQTFNVYHYSGDASLQVLIDQHILQSNVHLS